MLWGGTFLVTVFTNFFYQKDVCLQFTGSYLNAHLLLLLSVWFFIFSRGWLTFLFGWYFENKVWKILVIIVCVCVLYRFYWCLMDNLYCFSSDLFSIGWHFSWGAYAKFCYCFCWVFAVAVKKKFCFCCYYWCQSSE